MLARGDVLAKRYRIIERSGGGGMAEVYLGRDHALEREVAIKVLTGGPEDVRRRFLQEAQSMARLNHPNIVIVFDVGVDRHISFIILEYVRGTTLRELIRAGIEPDPAVGVVLQLCDALAYAHAQGIIHRDIKPGNVMVSDAGVVKVTDFGLARRMSDFTNFTQGGDILGTVAYLPPERFLGKQGDATGDLYAVGVMFFEMLTGRLPFKGKSDDLVSAMFAHVNDGPTPVRAINPTVPPALDRIIMRLLDKEPARRYPDALSLAADLRAARTELAHGAAGVASAEGPTEIAPAAVGSSTEVNDQPQRRGDDRADVRPLTSVKVTAALLRSMRGMVAAKAKRWDEAAQHYAAAVEMLKPMGRSVELARTLARFGAMYGERAAAGDSLSPGDMAAARNYLESALPVLRERHMLEDLAEAEAHLAALGRVEGA